MAGKNVLLTCTSVLAEQETGSKQEVGLDLRSQGHPTVTFSIEVVLLRLYSFLKQGHCLANRCSNILHSPP